MPGIGGAARLGTARGEIEIGTASLNSVVATTRSVGAQVKQNLGVIDAAAKNTSLRLAQISQGIGKVRGELTGLGIGSALLSGIGIKAAASFQDATVRLVGMTGGLKAATALTTDLRKQAQAAGIPFSDMLNVATRLLPTFQGNTKELEKWYGVIRRVATLNSQEGVTGAAFSINEAITSGGTDLVSLVERFNISRVQLRAALERNNGDMLASLDEVLTKMGITDQVAIELGKNFNASLRSTTDAAVQLLAVGFTPILNILTPLLQGTTAWLTQLQQTNPAIATLGAGLLSVATVGAPALLLFNQLVESGQKLKALGMLGGLGRLGVAGATIAVGATVGVGVANKIGAVTGSDAFSKVSMESLWANFRALIFSISYALNRGVVQMVNALAQASSALLHFAGDLLMTGAALLLDIGRKMPGNTGQGLIDNANTYSGIGLGLRTTGARAEMAAADNDEASKKFLESLANNFFGFKVKWGETGWDPLERSQAHDADVAATDPDAIARRAQIEQQANADILAAKLDWAANVKQIEAQAGLERLEATRQYESQRAEVIRSYEQSIAREAQDFGIARARQAAQLAKTIADIQADAAKREAEWWADLNEKIASIRSDGNERIADIERDYAKSRERAERDHRDTLMSAAGRLDAVAVAAEQRRYARQSTDAEEDFKERVGSERENLQERIEQENEAHAERLADARAADAERIADAQASLAEQQRIEDEDRALRLARQAEDHQAQLDQMAVAQAERLAQIDAQAALEKKALDDRLAQELEKLNIHNAGWLKLQEEKQKESLKMFDEFWKQFQLNFNKAFGPKTQEQSQSFFPGFANGGPVMRTGLANVHAGEYVLSKSMLANMAGAMPGMVGTGVPGSRNSSIGDISFVINAAPGMDANDIYDVIESRLMGLFKELAQ